MMLLAVVLQRAAGRPYSELIQERICQPLGMTSTAVRSATPEDKLEQGHDAAGTPVPHWDEPLPGAGGPEVCVTVSGPHFIEITAAGVTKASALSWLCESLGIESGEVIAFGDMPNDIPMLSWPGTRLQWVMLKRQ